MRGAVALSFLLAVHQLKGVGRLGMVRRLPREGGAEWSTGDAPENVCRCGFDGKGEAVAK